jgi:hypothetical protein
MRVAGSLKMGAVSASELIRRLQGCGRPLTLGQAIGELGRVAKTLYLLNYLDDEAYRPRNLTQLNRGESRHAVARAIFHGQRGELRQRYREGQEDQLGALGPVVNAVVLWNTRYLDAALAQVRASGAVVKPEHIERLSPLLLDHVNVLGRYEFALKESFRRGRLRPLRNPDELDDLAARRPLRRFSVPLLLAPQLRQLDQVSALAPEYPGWVLLFKADRVEPVDRWERFREASRLNRSCKSPPDCQ